MIIKKALEEIRKDLIGRRIKVRKDAQFSLTGKIGYILKIENRAILIFLTKKGNLLAFLNINETRRLIRKGKAVYGGLGSLYVVVLSET